MERQNTVLKCYKPGKENFFADALSRQHINAMQNEPQSDAATIHSEHSLTYLVESTDKPLSCGIPSNPVWDCK